MTIHIQYLGRYQLHIHGHPLDLTLRKLQALLIYLHLESGWHTREFLTDLLWPDQDFERASQSFRKTLSRVRQTLAPAGEVLLTRQGELCWNTNLQVTSDLDLLHEGLTLPTPDQITHLQQGFLPGFTLPDCPAFEGFLEETRTRVHQELEERLARWTGQAMRVKHSLVEPLIQARLQLDPLQEDAHQTWIRWLQKHHHTEHARKVYRDWQHKHQALLDLPLTVTWEDLQAAPPVQTEMPSSEPLTSFLARQQELRDLADLLNNTSCRLITVHGPGGVGKTRLAHRLLHLLQQEHQGKEGAHRVELEHLRTPGEVMVRVAETLGLSLPDHTLALQALTQYLRDRQTTLILDNFEHLMAAREDLRQLLQACPHVKVVVTSRVVLSLDLEQVYPLHGLSVTAGSQQWPDALMLLQERAKQLDPHFQLTPNTLPTARGICHHLAGLPLAIEMVASWLRCLPLDQVLEYLQKSELPLESTLTSTPDRQQSMERVLETSLRLLPGNLREQLTHLGVFQGGFSFPAAREVTGASLQDLRTLVNHSVLQVGGEGRFDFHPLVHQHLREHLTGEVLNQHRDHYVRKLAEMQEPLLSRTTARRALDTLEVEWDNVRAAWHQRVLTGFDLEHLGMVRTLTQYAELRGRNLETIELYEGALSRVNRVMWACLQGELAYIYMRKGDQQKSIQVAEAALPVLLEQNRPECNWSRWTLLQGWGASLFMQGRLDEAESCYVQSMEVATSDHSQAPPGLMQQQAAFRVAIAHVGFILVNMGRQNVTLIQHHLQEGLRTLEHFDSPYLCYLCYLGGQLHNALGDPLAALKWLEQGLTVSDDIGYVTLSAHILKELALTEQKLGNHSKARQILQRSLASSEKTGNRWAHLQLLELLGDLHREQGEVQQALEHYRQAFVDAASANMVGFVVGSVVSACEVLESQGGIEQARALLGFMLLQDGVPEGGRLQLEALAERLSAPHRAEPLRWQDLAGWAYLLPRGTQEQQGGQHLH